MSELTEISNRVPKFIPCIWPLVRGVHSHKLHIAYFPLFRKSYKFSTISLFHLTDGSTSTNTILQSSRQMALTTFYFVAQATL